MYHAWIASLCRFDGVAPSVMSAVLYLLHTCCFDAPESLEARLDVVGDMKKGGLDTLLAGWRSYAEREQEENARRQALSLQSQIRQNRGSTRNGVAGRPGMLTRGSSAQQLGLTRGPSGRALTRGSSAHQLRKQKSDLKIIRKQKKSFLGSINEWGRASATEDKETDGLGLGESDLKSIASLPGQGLSLMPDDSSPVTSWRKPSLVRAASSSKIDRRGSGLSRRGTAMKEGGGIGGTDDEGVNDSGSSTGSGLGLGMRRPTSMKLASFGSSLNALEEEGNGLEPVGGVRVTEDACFEILVEQIDAFEDAMLDDEAEETIGLEENDSTLVARSG